MSSQEGLPEDGISADLKNEQNAAKQMQKTFQTENSRWKGPEITKFRVKQFGKAGAQHRGCGWKAARQIRCWKALSLWHRGRTSSCKQGAMEEGVCHELVSSLGTPLSLQGKTGLKESTVRDTKPVRKVFLFSRPADKYWKWTKLPYH